MRNNVFYIMGKFVWEFYIEFRIMMGQRLLLEALVRKGLTVK
jgi:hypothetical protein